MMNIHLMRLSALYTWKFLSPGLLSLRVVLNEAIKLVGYKVFEIFHCVSGRRESFLYPILLHGQQVVFSRSLELLVSSSASLLHVPNWCYERTRFNKFRNSAFSMAGVPRLFNNLF